MTGQWDKWMLPYLQNSDNVFIRGPSLVGLTVPQIVELADEPNPSPHELRHELGVDTRGWDVLHFELKFELIDCGKIT